MRQPDKEDMINPESMRYTADLCGTISQSLKSLNGYGIMALELIQNADDAGASTLSLDVRDDALVVRNSAEFTNCGQYGEVCAWEKNGGPSGTYKSCNIHAISTMGARSKFETADQIGRFGIGFVSVFQVTDAPIIRSGNCELTLNPAAPQIHPKIVPPRPDTEFELPWATCETPVRKAIDASPVPPGIVEIVREEVLETIGSSVLFLRNLEVVEVFHNSELAERIAIERSPNSLVLHFEISKESKHWLLLTTSAEPIIQKRRLREDYPQLRNHNRSSTVTLAVAVDEEAAEGRLFAYLPTQQSSRLPLHLNGDFYPESSRKDIVLRGRGQERQWNEALIEAAAALIGEDFGKLKEQLGPVGLWRLGKSCYEQREDEIFGYYWNEFKSAAQQNTSVLSATGVWLQPESAYFSDEASAHEASEMFSLLGLPLISEEIRPYWTSLEAAGVRRLTAEKLIDVVAKQAPASDEKLRPHLGQIWHLVDQILLQKDSPHRSKIAERRLKSACILLDVDRAAAKPNNVWRIPEGVQTNAILRFLPNCPIVSPDVMEFPGLAELVDEYDLETFAEDLAKALATNEVARERIGEDGEAANVLYQLLLGFPTPTDSSRITGLLSAVPILRTGSGYITPERAQLPGGFEDPTGYLEFVDSGHFPPGMESFARVTLGVRVLSFTEYLEDHLPTIVEDVGLTPEAFCTIAEQIVRRRHELSADKVFHNLPELDFVPTRANTLVKPRDCYQWSADAERVLGPEPENWLDETWMPPGRVGAQFRDILENDLKMPSRPTLPHMLRRIERIAEAGNVTDETVSALDVLVDRICAHLPEMKEAERRAISELTDVAFLPALLRGQRDASRLYKPSEVYQATRASGFETQVTVIELNSLRRPGRHRTDFMNLIKMPQVPPVAVVVAHLRCCVEEGVKANTVAYDLLNEAVSEERDLAEVEALADEPYIFNAITEDYLKATEVFWSAPSMGNYWKRASEDMHRQVKLHDFLGVRSSPGPEDYARLMNIICGDPEPAPEYRNLHEQCVLEICRALDAEDDRAAEAIAILTDNACLLDLGGNAVFPSDVLWIDRPYLTEPFGTDLDHLLVEPPQIDRASLSRFYKRIGVKPLSELAVQKLALEPDRLFDSSATELLQDRSNLLLWLAPNEIARAALRRALDGLSIFMTQNLKAQVELSSHGAPVLSPPITAHAYLEAGSLHVRGTAMNQGAWTAAFRQIFLSIEHFCPQTDIKPLATTAVLVVKSDSREEAEAALVATDFAPPPATDWEAKEAAPLLDLEPELELEMEEHLNEMSSSDDDFARVDGLVDGPASEGAADVAHKPPEHTPFMEDGSPAARNNAGHMPHAATLAAEDTASSPNQKSVAEQTLGRSASASHEDHGEGKVPNDDDYKSKAGSELFGAEAGTQSSATRNPGTEDGGTASSANYQGRPKSTRMLAYVARSGDRTEENRDGQSDERNTEIDARAIECAMHYEADQGRSPIEQDHFNPGFDIISTENGGKRRLIEVKGLLGPWNERGTKLTRTQFLISQTHADEFWLYIVEKALDKNARQLFALHNPFQQVDEYWFDSAWKNVAERLADPVQLNARIGAKVHHEHWGNGHVIEIKKAGLQTRATVDFGFQGKKFVPFNILKFID